MADREYQLAVIGAGPGGYVAAIRARQLGLRVAVIERDRPGGVCLNMGCIPSKSLLHQAERYRNAARLEELGVKVDRSGFDYELVHRKSRAAADTLLKGVEFLFRKNQVELIKDQASLTDVHEVSLAGGRTIAADNIIIATGSRPACLPGLDTDERSVMTSNGALMMTDLPGKLVIVGAGPVGVEFAHIFHSFGVEVLLVEMLEHILPQTDQEVALFLARLLKKTGIRISASARAVSLQKNEGGLQVELEDAGGNRALERCDRLLVCAGRVPNTEGLGLEKLGIATRRGFIETGDHYQTSVPGIYAVGDVVEGTPLLAHTASRQGEMAVEHIAGLEGEPRLDPMLVPHAVYCEPEVAGFGYTEKAAREEGIDFAKAVFPYRGAGKSVAAEAGEGMVKVLHDRAGRILGAHICGHAATELIHEILLARKHGLSTRQVAEVIHAHPTLSEAVMESMRAAEGRAIHM